MGQWPLNGFFNYAELSWRLHREYGNDCMVDVSVGSCNDASFLDFADIFEDSLLGEFLVEDRVAIRL